MKFTWFTKDHKMHEKTLTDSNEILDFIEWLETDKNVVKWFQEVKDMFELVVIWATGEKDIDEFVSKEDAERAEIGMRTAFGNQIEWTGVRRKYD